jgi:hypothetical protein
MSESEQTRARKGEGCCQGTRSILILMGDGERGWERARGRSQRSWRHTRESEGEQVSRSWQRWQGAGERASGRGRVRVMDRMPSCRWT